MLQANVRNIEKLIIWVFSFLLPLASSSPAPSVSKSDLHEPMFELIKQVRVYSRPWVDKSFALVELEKDYMRQCHMIDVAIRKMEQMQLQVATIRSEKRVALWEKLTRRVMEVFPDHYGQYIDEQSIIPAIPAKEKHKERDKEKEKDENAAPGPGPVSDGTLSDLPVSRPSSSLSDGTSDEDDEDDDEDEDRNDMPHGTIKDSIRDYIAEDRPSWKRIARDLVVTFRGLLEDCHPDFQEVLGALHRRPFPRSPAPIYLSAHTGSILQRERRIPRMRKAWSTPDLRALARSEALMADPNLLVKAGLRRSNSFATFQTFRRRGRSYTIPHPFQFGLVPRRDNAPPTTALPVEPEQEQEDPLPETESEDSDPEDVVDMGGSLEDIEYMGDYDDEELEEVVNRFMEERPMVFPEEEHEGGGEGVEGGESGVEGEISAEIGEPMAVGRKATFSLQEIMELTMLHAQQMQLLQFEYEGRIQKMKIAMADQEAEHEEKVEAFEARVDMLHQRSKRIAHEYQKQAKEVMFADEKQRSARRSRTSTSRIGTAGGGSSRGGNGGGDANNDIPEDSIDMLVASGDMLSSKERESELGASREGRGSIRGDQGGTPGSLGASESRASSKQSSRKHSRQRGTMHSRQLQAQREAKAKKLRRAEKIARQRRSARSRFTPVFQSAPFAMSFMDRLRWFTEMKLQKRSRITEKFRRLEIDANEERLKQYQLLAPNATTATKDHSGEPNKLPAEFMPMPGDVPPAKRRAGELWGQQGITLPWGGRYNVHRGRRGQAVNILNLFDVAMSIELPRRKGQHYGRDD
ncbi:hypothetical protein PhCBS80983_g01256 [Powellomyces hirtus]|uniref:Uncharacterized protein n=1 Tax=Powellomyces hirtus TaxID=109895 RepID=A0A507EBQ5_9FUNG|nr:hypothetical protein PhCBS80983_g01256 [Powellomyces hirtus]